MFNEGQLERDFTYIDDIVSGVVAAAAAPPIDLEVRYRLLNLGNHQPVKLGDFIATPEGLLGKDANKQLVGMQPGDVYRTAANIDAARAWLALSPALISAPDLSASSRGTTTTIRCNPLR